MTGDKEKRRAISREAAKKRRRSESDVFGELSRLLPVQPSVQAHLDKPSVIRLTLSYLRMHALLKGNARTKANANHSLKYERATKTDENSVYLERREWDGWKDDAEELANMYLRTLEAFVMVLSTKGEIVFLSHNVSMYLGLSQVELMGHNILELAHPNDHEEIRYYLCVTEADIQCAAKREFVIRVKSALTHRGRNVNFKSATWKVLHCRAKVCSASSQFPYLLLTCQPLPLSHFSPSAHTFSSQHSMDMRFTYCDPRVMALLGYSHDELLGRSIYDFCYTLDIDRLTRNHLNLCVKGQSVSGQYRLLVWGGGYVWVESHCSVVPVGRPSRSRPRTHQSHCIISVTYVLSGVEEASRMMSSVQTVRRFIN